MGCCYVAQAVLILVSLSRLALNLKQLFCFSLLKASYYSNFFPAKLVLILIPCKIQILQSYYCFFPLIVCAFLSVCACSCMCMCGCVDARGGIWVPFLRIAFWGSISHGLKLADSAGLDGRRAPQSSWLCLSSTELTVRLTMPSFLCRFWGMKTYVFICRNYFSDTELVPQLACLSVFLWRLKYRLKKLTCLSWKDRHREVWIFLLSLASQ